MDELLGFNPKAAFIGDGEGEVHTLAKPDEMTQRDWERLLRSSYREPGWWDENQKGVPVSYLVGTDFNKHGHPVARFEDRIEPYEVFEDYDSNLRVRAVFLPSSHSEFFRWVIAVKQDTMT
jgi:hypothetical protein